MLRFFPNMNNINLQNIQAELQRMPAALQSHIQTWKETLQRSSIEMQLISELWCKILEHEALLINAKTFRQMRSKEQRMSTLFRSLDKKQVVMQQLLTVLQSCKLQVDSMRRRVRQWVQDDAIKTGYIVWELTASMFLEFLEFFTLRFDYEWEIKEMVVLELRRINSHYDLDILFLAWSEQRHAGGSDFDQQLKDFYKSVGVRPCRAVRNPIYNEDYNTEFH